jgi:MFS family permease
MFGTAAMTATVDAAGRGRRGRAVSALLISETLGLLLGTSLGGALYEGLGLATPFVFESACMLLAAVVLAGWRAPAAPFRSPSLSRRRDWQAVAAVLRTPGVPLMGFVSAALVSIQTGVLVFLFPAYLSDRGRLGPSAIGIIVGLSVLGRLVALWLGGSLSDRWGRMRILGPGLLVVGLLLAVLPAMRGPGLFALWGLAIGIASGAVAPVPAALVGDLVPAGHHGVAIGWLRTMTDTGHVMGPLVMGYAADTVDLAAPFLVGAALLLGLASGCHRRARTM